MNARKRRTAEGRRRTNRLKCRRVEGGLLGSERGAKKSESVPVRRRAKVEVSAMMETCVDAVPAGGGPWKCLGVNVGMIVPRLLMYASPGPVRRKKPAASSHIVRSVRKVCVA